MLCTGVLLYFANRTPAESQPLSTRHAWWIGLAQAIAILPGLSRSGATIGTALAPKGGTTGRSIAFVFNGDSSLLAVWPKAC